MPRPKKSRRCRCKPGADYFAPKGVAPKATRETVLQRDEFEALKLADYDDLAHKEAAIKMGISRQTFGRIIKSARNKTAAALVKGNALKIIS